MSKSTTPKVSDLLASSSQSKQKRQEMKQDDEFTRTFRGIFGQIEKNAKGILIGISTVLLVGILGSVWVSLNQTQEKTARSALYQANLVFQEEENTFNEKNNAQLGDEKSSAVAAVIKPDQDLPKTIEAFSKVAQEHEGTLGGFHAAYRLGELYFQNGESGKSVPWFEKATQQAQGQFHEASSWAALGYAYEETGDLEKAKDAFQKALDQGKTIFEADLLMALARTQEATGDQEGARKSYEKVIENFKDTDLAQNAEAFKNALQ